MSDHEQVINYIQEYGFTIQLKKFHIITQTKNALEEIFPEKMSTKQNRFVS